MLCKRPLRAEGERLLVGFEVHLDLILGHFRCIRKFLGDLKIPKTLGVQ